MKRILLLVLCVVAQFAVVNSQSLDSEKLIKQTAEMAMMRDIFYPDYRGANF